MSSIVIAGDTSGSVTLQAPAVAGTTILTLPATSGTLSTSASQWTTTGSNIYYTTGNVGIGTSTIGTTLVLANSDSSTIGQLRYARSVDTTFYWETGRDNQLSGDFLFSNASGGAKTERMRINGSGTVILQGGSTSATGVGITFPATQSASSNANTLDDYEEGTWTPSIGGTATYNEAVGNYVKVGKMVTVNADIWIASIGTGSAGTVSGLPFTKASGYNQGCYTYYWNALSVSITNLYPWIDTTTVKFHTVGAAATGVNNTINILQNNARVQFTAVYYV